MHHQITNISTSDQQIKKSSHHKEKQVFRSEPIQEKNNNFPLLYLQLFTYIWRLQHVGGNYLQDM